MERPVLIDAEPGRRTIAGHRRKKGENGPGVKYN
jgi:hypothetical protein